MIEHPQPVDPKKLHNRSGGPRPVGEAPLTEPEKTRLAGTVVRGLVAGLSMLFLSPNEDHPLSARLEQTQVKTEAGLRPEVKKTETLVANKAEIEKTAEELQILLQKLADKSSVPALSSNNIREACRITSDWFLKESHNLQIVWEYLKSRKSNWPTEIEKVLDDAIALGKPLARFSSKVPTTRQDLENIVNEKFGELKPAKCGWMLSLASAYLDDAQGLGSRMATETARFIANDLKTNDPARASEALQAGNALIQALESARKR